MTTTDGHAPADTMVLFYLDKLAQLRWGRPVTSLQYAVRRTGIVIDWVATAARIRQEDDAVRTGSLTPAGRRH